MCAHLDKVRLKLNRLCSISDGISVRFCLDMSLWERRIWSVMRATKKQWMVGMEMLHQPGRGWTSMSAPCRRAQLLSYRSRSQSASRGQQMPCCPRSSKRRLALGGLPSSLCLAQTFKLLLVAGTVPGTADQAKPKKTWRNKKKIWPNNRKARQLQHQTGGELNIPEKEGSRPGELQVSEKRPAVSRLRVSELGAL